MKKVQRKVTRERLVAAIQEAAEKISKGKPLSLRQFLLHAGMHRRVFYGEFRTWKEAMEAAGFDRPQANLPLTAEELLEDWGKTVRRMRRMPSQRDYCAQGGRYHPQTITNRCGRRWSELPDCFREFARGRKKWGDVLGLLPAAGVCKRPLRPGGRSAAFRATARPGERVYGAPIDFKNIRHAPVNEMGVVHLFGAMSQDLGFLVESVQCGFPDCIVKQRASTGEWRQRRIEFEYESRNFHDHGHATDGCDMIVCWNHNWPECPANLEVIALSDEIKKRAAQ